MLSPNASIRIMSLSRFDFMLLLVSCDKDLRHAKPAQQCNSRISKILASPSYYPRSLLFVPCDGPRCSLFFVVGQHIYSAQTSSTSEPLNLRSSRIVLWPLTLIFGGRTLVLLSFYSNPRTHIPTYPHHTPPFHPKCPPSSRSSSSSAATVR